MDRKGESRQTKSLQLLVVWYLYFRADEYRHLLDRLDEFDRAAVGGRMEAFSRTGIAAAIGAPPGNINFDSLEERKWVLRRRVFGGRTYYILTKNHLLDLDRDVASLRPIHPDNNLENGKHLPATSDESIHKLAPLARKHVATEVNENFLNTRVERIEASRQLARIRVVSPGSTYDVYVVREDNIVVGSRSGSADSNRATQVEETQMSEYCRKALDRLALDLPADRLTLRVIAIERYRPPVIYVERDATGERFEVSFSRGDAVWRRIT